MAGKKKEIAMKKILVVAAHPDDEILGCGGTVAAYVARRCDAYVLILGEGVTSRDGQSAAAKCRELKRLKEEAHAANRAIGVKDIFLGRFPDNSFDSVPLLDIVKAIERVKDSIRPDIVFTHDSRDLNIDHRITYDAVLTACRPLPGESVKEIYSFEILSSSEWNYPSTFIADTFFDISLALECKIKALSAYVSELREFPHPRSLKGVRLSAEYRGMQAGLRAAEAFKTVRLIKD